MANFLTKILSAGAGKELKSYRQTVKKINDLEPQFEQKTDEEMHNITQAFRDRYEQGESLDALLPEAFAAVREAAKRTIGQRHFDVQLIGAMALHSGAIAEMKTGEGKTLVSTLAGYLNAIPGKGVHIVTVNDYLAKRDSEWMGQIYRFLGMSVGLLQNGMRITMKKPAYAADITYGTNSEFGFDYLRDNMVTSSAHRVQRSHHYAIVDEADSILIDEARTPLIISGSGSQSANTYQQFAQAVRGLVSEQDYELDEAKKTIAASEEGLEKIERRLGIDDIYADTSGQLVNHLQQALKAEYMFHRDQQYVVIDGEVKIVDEFTGRIMEGRRYSEGLHQAIEAKEGVMVRDENQTLATITLQNYFLMYDKLSGMTGTAMTEDAEFREVYHVGVQVVPPNKPVIRKDNDDKVFRTVDIKFNAVADDVEARHKQGQPVLVGTVSIENSEKLSALLRKRGVAHNVLNAKFHEREAQIVAQAGRLNAVTIATNMAGRGTDILLGGNPDLVALDMLREQGIEPDEATGEQKRDALAAAQEICKKEHEQVLEAGGLCVIGTERHESRRIDNQLRGRSGRQGDPGETQFYLSLEDDLMRLFGGDRMDRLGAFMLRHDMPDDMPIQFKLVTKVVEGSQRKVEQVNFAMRKQVLDYDNVMNKQRQVIYEERNNVLDGKDLTEQISDIITDAIATSIECYCPEAEAREDWDTKGLEKWLFDLTGDSGVPALDECVTRDDLASKAEEFVSGCYKKKCERLGELPINQLASQIMLRVIDTRWMTYLQEMEYLRTGIGLRGFGQRDPLVEYKQEAYAAFQQLVNTMYVDFLQTLLRIEVVMRSAQQEMRQPTPVAAEDDPEELKGARYSGPSEQTAPGVRLGQGTVGSQAQDAAGIGALGGREHSAQAVHQVANRHTGVPIPRNEHGRRAVGPGPQGAHPGQSKASTYRKADDPDPYVGVGRNDLCPCGSGKKFKNCHGKTTHLERTIEKQNKDTRSLN